MRLWKSFRTNLMYWRFRYVTRNRLRLKNWWSRSRPGSAHSSRSRRAGSVPPGFRPRGAATSVVYSGRSRRRTWTALIGTILFVVLLRAFVAHTYVDPSIVNGVGALGVIAGAYWALRGL